MLAEMPEIGVVVTLHREGLLAAATLASAFEAAEFARVKGKTVRLLAVLDQPDAVTRSVLESWRHGAEPQRRGSSPVRALPDNAGRR
jgi:hypothetical protein